jgi:carbon-monoxide dehydrogenase medium subunit
MPSPAYHAPDTIEQAVALLAGNAGARPMAGGTDLIVQMRSGRNAPSAIVDIKRIAGLSGVRVLSGGGFAIGAATPCTALKDDVALSLAWPGVVEAANLIGSVQVRNRATMAGNLCNASPAADGVPPLLTLDAEVELASPRGIRRLALADFIEGPRRTACAPDEILTAVHVPKAALQGRASFLKLGARAHLVISIVMVACRVVEQDGRVAEISLAAGSCSPVARRLSRVEAALLGQPMAGLAEKIRAEDVAAHLAPIEDIRASAGYRLEAATELLRRVLGGLA